MHSLNSSVRFEDRVIKKFILATFFWALFGMVMGVWIALQLTFPVLNFDTPWTNFGRLRPLHTTGVVVAFTFNFLMAASFYIVQRTCRVPLAMPCLANILFYLVQIFLVSTMLGYVLGITQSKEYAEAEWYNDILLTILWVIYGIIFFVTIHRRESKHIYVANWFFMAFIITVAVLHIVNSLAIPISLTSSKSYPLFSGIQSATIQWWYGHNMVGFLLTTAFVGTMYYFVPKRTERPIYSYKVSIIHFWSLIFMYIWVGPHHLIYTSIPDWTQTLGVALSIMLWIPSWGGVINGVMTISPVWYKLRTDPVLKFLLAAVAFYGMSTFEGPMMAIKSINALSHYTNWTVSHVHSGALGWVAFMAFAGIYHMVPILWNKRDLYSRQLVNLHLWLASIGILLYICSMWVAGIMEGLMWRSYNDNGFLSYSFIEIVVALKPYYFIRALGGILYLAGAIIMVYNLVKTICMDEGHVSDTTESKEKLDGLGNNSENSDQNEASKLSNIS